MTLALGDKVIKKPCPMGCPCDGNQIPPGSEGEITVVQHGAPEATDSWSRRREITMGKLEEYYHVAWNVGGRTRYWWTFLHGLDVGGNFPDELWIS